MAHSSQQEKRPSKAHREKNILIALVEHYLKTKKPIGSQTLQEAEFSELSSATLRNYFAKLEAQGFLKQQHSSGGRIPEPKAYIAYAHHCEDLFMKDRQKKREKPQQSSGISDEKDVMNIIEKAAESLSTQTKTAVAVTSPRFDHDTVSSVQFVFIDIERVLCVVISEFGLVSPSLISVPFRLSHSLLRKADRFCRSRLFGEKQEPIIFSEKELNKVRYLYQEAMARFFINYSSISEQDLWRTGFSHLLPSNISSIEEISSAVTLFENTGAIRGFSKEAVKSNQLRFWIGEELFSLTEGTPNCAVIAMPYCVKGRPIGALVTISNMQINYKKIFQSMGDIADDLSTKLSAIVLHHKLQYRMASPSIFAMDQERLALDFSQNLLLTQQI